MPFRSYFKTLAMIICAYFMLCVGTNWAVDPFNELGRNKIGLYFSTQRQAHKKIESIPHQGILMGSSKVGQIKADSLKCSGIYNASFNAALPEEMHFFLRRYALDEKIVLIGLDFYMFNERQLPLNDLNEWPDHFFGIFEYLMSFNVFKSSFVGLYKWSDGQEPKIAMIKIVSQDKSKVLGSSVFSQNLEIKNRINTNESSMNNVKNDFSKMIGKKGHPNLDMISNNHFRRYQFSKKRMEYISKTSEMLRDRGIPYLFFINPIYHDVYSMIMNSENKPIFMTFQNQLQDILGESLIDLSYNQYSFNDSFGESGGDFYHYTPKTGTKFVDAMLNCTNR